MFDDRTHAGQLLAEKLATLALKSPYILAVPRGLVRCLHRGNPK